MVNFLEFCAIFITLWLELREGAQNKFILELSDSSSALSWLRKSSFMGVDKEGHLCLARHLALLLLNQKAVLYSQHIAGILNVVADSLSRDFHLSNSALTYVYLHAFLEQIPS